MRAPSTFTDIHQPKDSRIRLLGPYKSFLYPWCWPSPVPPGAAISEAAPLLKFPRRMHFSQLNILFWPPASLSHTQEGFPGSPSQKLLALVPYLFLREPTSETVVAVMQAEGCCYSGGMCAVSGTPAMLYFLTCGGDLQFKYLLFIKWYTCVFSCTFPYIYIVLHNWKHIYLYLVINFI